MIDYSDLKKGTRIKVIKSSQWYTKGQIGTITYNKINQAKFDNGESWWFNLEDVKLPEEQLEFDFKELL